MELAKIINDENTFDPTPKLKSSPIPIKFISFNTKILRKCLSDYLTNITNINIYLDVYYKTNLECNHKHGITVKEPQIIQECYRNLKISIFRQLFTGYVYDVISFNSEHSDLYNKIIESERYCKLCKTSLYDGTNTYETGKTKLCSECYLISSGYMESDLTKKPIPIIYLPWWYYTFFCVVCLLNLKFTTDCQKFCEKCLIFYIGCRNCLTTNIIFGLATQSQCKKCKGVSSITSISSGNSELDEFLINLNLGIYNNLRIDEFSDKIKNNDKYFLPSEITLTIRSMCQNYENIQSKILMDQSERSIEWIPYSQFTNVVEIAEGGFGIIYCAIRGQQNVILKKFKNSQDTSKYFLNELKSNQTCFESKHHIIRTHGITKDPKSGDYMLVMQFASGGDLHNWLQKKFAEIKWNKDKLIILWQISEGLETIHKARYVHRDFHSGNILHDLFHNNSQERFKKRHQWLIGDLGLSQPINDASNNEIYGLEKLGPEFAKKPHPKAIYTSRSLSPYISKCSSINSSSSINKQDYNYISKEQEFDIDIKSNSLAITSNKRSIEESNIEIHDNNRKYVKTSSSYPKTL
ncbi:kinase-like domain-containing protein [Rhizophagus clarus]|uniref:Kinase-like domain-containing protein n=1 Tax=Rhizophagus clarus TaxID=94130 RepID=A0A8H3QI33_9GLOM|nr:kinase-like domain-containing protein [Rhizophagus clarus]